MDNSTKSYYKSIDGLRFFCFFIVFLFHCQIPGFQLGWSGVTFFFVISGFLITEILINSKKSSSYFKSFYIRRALRIFPIYYIVIIGVAILFFIVNKRIPNDLLYYITYTQNIYWIPTQYSSDMVPFLAHTWTLSIEEQFYLIWPLIIWIVPNKRIPDLCVWVMLFAILFRGVSIFFDNVYITSILLPS